MGQLAAVFPGQGSQYVGMGKDLADAFAIAREAFELADEVLGFSLSRICWEGPEEELTRTQNAQPAILVHSYAAWSILQDDISPRVKYTAGHSLGEFSAYAAAGSLGFEEAVRLVRRRGELMAEAGAGTMSAVVGLDPGVVEGICEDVRSEGGIVVTANYNSPQQLVISGEADAVESAGARAREAGAKMVRPLAVSGAFHSPLMADAESGLQAELDNLTFTDPKFPVVSNVTAQPVADADTARRTLVRQLTSPVRWTQDVQRIAEEGVVNFVEIGPGKVLTGLLRRIDRGLSGVEVGKPEDVGRFKEGLS